jgi:eukaryotic-like serine/threonine-protein kinase
MAMKRSALFPWRVLTRSVESASPLFAGQRLGPYEIVAIIGAGGMGDVYRARDPRLGRDVAIKVLPIAFSADADRLRRFEQEAHAAAALNHPNILAVYDIGTQADAPFIVSELLEGQTLGDRLNAGPVAARKAIEQALQIAHGLAAAHDKGIVHRDLKPENVFITQDNRIKILDFGLAKLTQGRPTLGTASALATMPSPTQPGMVLGTVGYMAPEQVRGLDVDHRADLFAFGAILYELLSGGRAFRRDTAPETMAAILNEEPPDLRAAGRPISPALARIVERCLEKNPSARFQTASDLAFALSGVSDASSAPGTGRVDAARHTRWLGWGLAALLLATLAPFAYRHARERPATPDPVRFQIPPIVELGGPGNFSVSPDGRRLVFIGRGSDGVARLWIRNFGTLDAAPEAQSTQRLMPYAVGLTYAPSGDSDAGRLLFLRDGTLMAQPFDGTRECSRSLLLELSSRANTDYPLTLSKTCSVTLDSSRDCR